MEHPPDYPHHGKPKSYPSDGYKTVDANGQAFIYVYDRDNRRDAGATKALTLDDARRILR